MARPRKADVEARERKKMASDEYVSQFYIDPATLDPNFKYRFVETQCMNQDTQSVNNAIRDGYSPVKWEELPGKKEDADMMAAIRGRANADPYVRQGDQILMKTPIENFNNLKKAERKQSKQQTNSVEWAAQSQAIKAPTFVTDDSYSRTQERSAAVDRAFAADEE